MQPTSCGLESPLVGEPKWGVGLPAPRGCSPFKGQGLGSDSLRIFPFCTRTPHLVLHRPCFTSGMPWCGTASMSRTLEKDLWLLIVELRDYRPRGRASPASRAKNSTFSLPFLLSLSLCVTAFSQKSNKWNLMSWRFIWPRKPACFSSSSFFFLFFFFFLREALEVFRAFYPSVLENSR